MKVCSTPSEGLNNVTETPVPITNCTDPFTKSLADLALVLFDGGECHAGLRFRIDAGVTGDSPCGMGTGGQAGVAASLPLDQMPGKQADFRHHANPSIPSPSRSSVSGSGIVA